METTYGFPKTDPGAVLAAADELSLQYREGSIRRANADGSIDLVACEGSFSRRFLRFRIEADGTTFLVGEGRPPASYGFDIALALGGGFVFAWTIIALIARSSDDFSPWLEIGLLGFVAAFVGVVRANRSGLEWYVRETFGTDGGWQRVYATTDWSPSSLTQLQVIEGIAEKHRGKAYVCRGPDGVAEVVAMRLGRVRRFRVEPDGTLIAAGSQQAVRCTLGALTLILGAFALIPLSSALSLSFAPKLELAVVVIGVALMWGDDLRGRVRQLPGDWHLVQTRDDSD